MDDPLTTAPPPGGRTLTISVDIQPREVAAVIRFGVARTFRWRQLLSPVILFAAAGFLVQQLRHWPTHPSTIAASLLFGAVVALGAFLTFPYLVGVRLARSASRNRIQLAFGPDGIRVKSYDGEPWLPWTRVQVIETSQMLHFVTDDASCWLPKRLLNPAEDALVRQLAVRTSGHVLPSR